MSGETREYTSAAEKAKFLVAMTTSGHGQSTFASPLHPQPNIVLLKNNYRVKFQLQSTIAIMENSYHLPKRSKIKMTEVTYQRFAGNEITNDMLTQAANLFSENYGIWDQKSGRSGQPIRLSAKRLRTQCVPETAEIAYSRVIVDGNLAGNAFACRWKHDGKTVCWVTQLVVSRHYRERGLAKGLLTLLRQDSDDIYGIMSSHPAACLAAARAFSGYIEKVSLDFIGMNAKSIMSVSPISYIRDAKLCGSVFDPVDTSKLVSGVDTAFFVDHEEPMKALGYVRQTLDWPLGELPDGHEYLLVMATRRSVSQGRV